MRYLEIFVKTNRVMYENFFKYKGKLKTLVKPEI